MLSSRTESHNNSEALTPTSNRPEPLGRRTLLKHHFLAWPTVLAWSIWKWWSGGDAGNHSPKLHGAARRLKQRTTQAHCWCYPTRFWPQVLTRRLPSPKREKTYRFNTFSNQSYHLWPAVLHLVSHTELNFSNQLFIFCISYRCKVCPLTFLNKSEMQMHSKSHTEAKPHKCPHCSKSFANASYLSQHLRIHLGIKPYHCSYCENSFRQLSHLQQHTRSAELTAMPLVHVQLKTIQPD